VLLNGKMTPMGILQTAIPPEIQTGTGWHVFIDADDADGLWALSTRLFTASRAEGADPRSPAIALLRLLSAATSMRLTDGAKPPFQPMIIWHGDNKRSPAIEDFDVADVETLAAVAAVAPTPLVRARLADVAATAGVELDARQWRSGALAVEAYLELAERHLLEEDGIKVLTEFVRGLRLAWVYHRKDETIHARYWDLAQKAITKSLQSNSPGLGLLLVEEVKRARKDLAASVATELETAAARYASQSDFDTVARCFELAHQLWDRIGKRDEAKRCHLAQGEALVARASLGNGAAMAKGIWLAEGIEVLRRAGADPGRITQLRHELAETQRQSLGDFRRIEHTMDATEIIKAIEASVVGPTLMDSLLQMTFGFWNWPRFDKVRQDVIDAAAKHPLSHLFSSQHVDAEGTVVAQQKAFDANDLESIYQTMVKHVHDFDVPMRAQLLVMRAADIIFCGHHPGLTHLLEILYASPVVPPDHEESIARGLLAGINDDWLEAATYLIPQVEPFVRHQFRQRGLITLTMREDGVQSEKSLTELLASEAAAGILGKDLILELDALMVHPMGYGLRHKWAHGLVDDQQLLNPGVFGLWWTFWRLILWPWAIERHEAAKRRLPVAS
jgi:hypothetical protein